MAGFTNIGGIDFPSNTIKSYSLDANKNYSVQLNNGVTVVYPEQDGSGFVVTRENKEFAKTSIFKIKDAFVIGNKDKIDDIMVNFSENVLVDVSSDKGVQGDLVVFSDDKDCSNYVKMNKGDKLVTFDFGKENIFEAKSDTIKKVIE